MEYTEGTLTKEKHINIHPYEYEQASNGYLMAIVAVIAGLPLPIVNVLASLIYYLSNLKSSYFIKWHSLQAVLAQLIIVPFNSIAWAWAFAIMWQESKVSVFFVIYIFFVLILNITEFIAVIATSSKVRNGENVRWAVVANITDALCKPSNKN